MRKPMKSGSKMTAGAGGGLGRIEKSAAVGKGYKKGGMVKKGKC